MIERLVVHRFRGIKEGVLNDLGKINVLIGPNNSGKTALLEMLYLSGTSGRKVSLILEDSGTGHSIKDATVPIKYDFLGFEPLPRLRKRHGYKDLLDDNPAVLTSEGGIAVNLESLIEKDGYLFRWDEIPGEDSEKLKDFLAKRFCVKWVKKAGIKKTDEGKTIKAFDEKNSLTLKLDAEAKEAILEIDDVRTYEFDAKIKNGQLGIYIKTIKGLRLVAPLESWGEKSLRFNEDDIGNVASFGLDRLEDIPRILIPPFFEPQNVSPEKSRWNYLWENIWVYQREQRDFIDHFAVWAEEGLLPDPERVLLFDFHAANGHFKNQFIKNVRDSIRRRWEEKIEEMLIHVFQLPNDTSVEIDDAPGTHEWKSGYVRFPDSARIPVDQFGDGMRHSFKVLTSLVALAELVDDEHPGLFLWEEPELFMHPATLIRLMREVVGVIKKRPIQVFISTQNLDVLAWISQMLNEKYIEPKSISAFSLMLKPSGELSARLFLADDFVSWMESGFDIRDSETAMIDLSPITWRLKRSGEEEILD